MQKRLIKGKIAYNSDPYNKWNDQEQWIRISDGCPNNCPYCYCPTELKQYPIPEIIRSKVKIMDMNLLAQKNALSIINDLPKAIGKYNNLVDYELTSGIDFRFLTQEIANALKKKRFIKIRFAWDWFFKDQKKIRGSFLMLIKAGYKAEELSCFMLCNWKIPYKECCRKLDLLKVWNVKVNDCYFDNQTFPNVNPEFWKDQENKEFRSKCRKHNQLVRFKIDPEIKEKERIK